MSRTPEREIKIVSLSKRISNGNLELIIRVNQDGSKQLIPNLGFSSRQALTLNEAYDCLDDESIYIHPDLRTAIILTKPHS